MKIVILCTLCFSAAWAMPKGQSVPPFKRLYVDSVDLPRNDLNPRILNGTEAVPHSIPFQVYLIVSRSPSDGWSCGGSLISPMHILTAAHCIVDGVYATVYLGVHNILSSSEGSRVVLESKNLIYHSEFSKATIANDIGVIVLDNPVEFNEYINIVALPTLSDVDNSYSDQNARVSGWGLETRYGGTSPVLREVNSTVLSNMQCSLIFSDMLDSQVCISGFGGVGACNGDSGGPLVVGNTLIGIVSYGTFGCPSGSPTAFTRVTSYLDWIEENTGIIISK